MKNERYSSGLKNLHLLIQQASTRYANEFVWQDVKLTDEFKNAYAEVLQSNAYDIEFFDCSAVITTSQGRYIFVPNQWFVIASYPLDVYMELMLSLTISNKYYLQTQYNIQNHRLPFDRIYYPLHTRGDLSILLFSPAFGDIWQAC